NVEVQCGTSINSLVVQPVAGAWSADVPVQECRCSGSTIVTALCDAKCDGTIVEKAVWKGRLVCEGECPTVTLSANVGDCDSNRYRSVDYIIQFAPPLPVGTTGGGNIAFGTLNSNAQASAMLPSINVTSTSLSSETFTTSLPPSILPFQSTVTV